MLKKLLKELDIYLVVLIIGLFFVFFVTTQKHGWLFTSITFLICGIGLFIYVRLMRYVPWWWK